MSILLSHFDHNILQMNRTLISYPINGYIYGEILQFSNRYALDSVYFAELENQGEIKFRYCSVYP